MLLNRDLVIEESFSEKRKEVKIKKTKVKDEKGKFYQITFDI